MHLGLFSIYEKYLLGLINKKGKLLQWNYYILKMEIGLFDDYVLTYKEFIKNYKEYQNYFSCHIYRKFMYNILTMISDEYKLKNKCDGTVSITHSIGGTSNANIF